MYIIGLTGGIGSGKTTASNYLHLCGASVVDLDNLTHQLTKKDTEVTKTIQKEFKEQFELNVSNPDGSLNKNLIRNYAFTNKQVLTKLENLIYPELRKVTLEKIKTAQGPYIVLVIPLLVEKKFFLEKIDRILLLDCSEETQIQRVMKRNQLNRIQVKKIIANQANRQERLAIADDIIVNENKNKKDLTLEIKRYHYIYRTLASKKY